MQELPGTQTCIVAVYINKRILCTRAEQTHTRHKYLCLDHSRALGPHELDRLLDVYLIIPAWHAWRGIQGRSGLDAKHKIAILQSSSTSTLVRDEVDEDVDHNKSARSSNTCRAVHHDWSGGEALRSESALFQSDI